MRPKNSGGDRAQTLVEWAFILPVIILITMMILDFGRIVYYYSVVYNAAREGARYGIVHFQPYNEANIVAAVRQKTIGMDDSLVTITPRICNLFPAPGTGCLVVHTPRNATAAEDTIRVQVSYSFSAITPIIWEVIGANPINVSSTAEMRIEK